MGRWEVFKELRRAMKDPARIGDVPVYKGELGRARARPEVEALLDDVRGYHPRLDFSALAALPEETFGHAYARFMRAHALDPFVVSDIPPRDMVERNAFVVRYGIIHDMVHVLTGFDTTWSGEAGVWGFVGGQNYSRGFNVASWAALLVAPFRTPLSMGRTYRAWKRGRAMGRAAKMVLPVRLEDHLGRPLDDVRRELSIAVAQG